MSVVVGALALGLLASPVDARRNGATFPDNDVNPPRDGLIIEDVMDVRQDGDRGRDSDVDVENPGNACVETDNVLASNPGRSDVDDDVPADVNCD